MQRPCGVFGYSDVVHQSENRCKEGVRMKNRVSLRNIMSR